MLSVRIYTGEPEQQPEVQVYLATFNFQKTDNCFVFATLERFDLCLKYSVNKQHLVFTIPKVIDRNGLNKVFKPKEVEVTHEMTKRKDLEAFINGAIIYDPASAVVLINPEATEENSVEKEKKELQQKGNYKFVYISIGLILLIGCVSAFWLYPWFKKKVMKKRKLKRAMKK